MICPDKNKARAAKAQWTRPGEGGQTGRGWRGVGRAGRVLPSWQGVWILFQVSEEAIRRF